MNYLLDYGLSGIQTAHLSVMRTQEAANLVDKSSAQASKSSKEKRKSNSDGDGDGGETPRPEKQPRVETLDPSGDGRVRGKSDVLLCGFSGPFDRC
jgi:hypothetical protein